MPRQGSERPPLFDVMGSPGVTIVLDFKVEVERR
jgi:hypothetical protein